MMRWLTQYIDENKYAWERRRKEPPENEIEKWTNMDEEEMIAILKETEDREAEKNEPKVKRAGRRKTLWREWRTENDEKERAAEQEKQLDIVEQAHEDAGLVDEKAITAVGVG